MGIIFYIAIFFLLVMLVMFGFYTGFLYALIMESRKPKPAEKMEKRIVESLESSECDYGINGR